MCLCTKQSSLFSFYALPSGAKPKGMLIHLQNILKALMSSTF